MVEAALTPYSTQSDLMMVATLWLQSYFDKFGSPAPNREEIHIRVMQKYSIYEMYKAEFERVNPPRSFIEYTDFIMLWNAIFPRYVSRPWCDIPGKCDTCYAIDYRRRNCGDNIVLEKLKAAHHLHRGGLVMMERMRLVFLIFNIGGGDVNNADDDNNNAAAAAAERGTMPRSARGILC